MIEKLIGLAVIKGIIFYQRSLSPSKGYGCAYRTLLGANSGCSGFAKHAIREFGFLKAIPYIRMRLIVCRTIAKSSKVGLSCPYEVSLIKINKQMEELENIASELNSSGEKVKVW